MGTSVYYGTIHVEDSAGLPLPTNIVIIFVDMIHVTGNRIESRRRKRSSARDKQGEDNTIIKT